MTMLVFGCETKLHFEFSVCRVFPVVIEFGVKALESKEAVWKLVGSLEYYDNVRRNTYLM